MSTAADAIVIAITAIQFKKLHGVGKAEEDRLHTHIENRTIYELLINIIIHLN